MVPYTDRRLSPKAREFSPKVTVLFDETSLHSTLSQPRVVPGRQFVAHASSRSRAPDSHRSGGGSARMTARRRFVAGEAFFNYEAFGSLRPEFMPIQLFSSDFVGLAVTALASGLVITLLKFAYRQLLGEYLRLHHNSYATSISFLLEWPASFSIFLGFLSDCRPIGGNRRKPYMILGWLLACVCFAIVAVLDFTIAKSWDLLDFRATQDADELAAVRERVTQYGGLLIGITLVATMAIQLMYITSLSMTVEFAQRETLQERGKLQAMFFILYYISGAIAQAIATSFVLANEDGHVRSKLALGETAIILAAACLVPIPFLLSFLDEPPLAGTTVHFSVRRRVHELWRFCHQNVVNRILAFLVIHFFIIGLYNKNARSAISTWSHITEAKLPIVNAVDSAGLCIALVFWMLFMVNWPWRTLAGVGSVAYIVGYIFFTALVVFDVVRDDWFYIVASAILDMPRAWIRLYAVVLSTEIADNGREGVTLGLVFASQQMVGVASHMLSAGFGNWLPFHVSDEDVLADSAHTRQQVMSGSAILFAINFLSVFVVFVLPQQKLDAQQLRAFGGYNRYASYAIAFMFTLLFAGTFAMNTMALTK